eukprot:639272-Lingulodinium_polyedra.AAC.1
MQNANTAQYRCAHVLHDLFDKQHGDAVEPALRHANTAPFAQTQTPHAATRRAHMAHASARRA